MTFYQTMTLKIDFYLATHANFRDCHTLCHRTAADLQTNRKNINIYFSKLEDLHWYNRFFWERQINALSTHHIDQNKIKIIMRRPAANKNFTQINMCTSMNQLDDSVEHLIQVIPNNDTDKQQARLLYKHYQQQGHQITVHKDA